MRKLVRREGKNERKNKYEFCDFLWICKNDWVNEKLTIV
jgi:hypothetical protein